MGFSIHCVVQNPDTYKNYNIAPYSHTVIQRPQTQYQAVCEVTISINVS